MEQKTVSPLCWFEGERLIESTISLSSQCCQHLFNILHFLFVMYIIQKTIT